MIILIGTQEKIKNETNVLLIDTRKNKRKSITLAESSAATAFLPTPEQIIIIIITVIIIIITILIYHQ